MGTLKKLKLGCDHHPHFSLQFDYQEKVVDAKLQNDKARKKIDRKTAIGYLRQIQFFPKRSLSRNSAETRQKLSRN